MPLYKIKYILSLTAYFMCFGGTTKAMPQNFQKVLLLMGSRFEIHIVAKNNKDAQEHIQAAINEIKRIEHLISSWDTLSETTHINQHAGKNPIAVSDEFFYLIERCINISQITQGAFDITTRSLMDIWKFDHSMKQLPTPQKIKEQLALVNYKNIILNKKDKSIFLQNKNMKIGFGAIGKGYAAYKTSRLLKQRGIKNGLVNAGGDLTAWGHQANGQPWTVAISDPQDKKKIYATLNASNTSIVTSGDYEKFSVISGKKYTHILDPRTGYPSTTNLRSVTIVCNSPELGDALATAVFVLGEELGLTLINRLQGVEGLIIANQNRLVISDNLKLNNIE